MVSGGVKVALCVWVCVGVCVCVCGALQSKKTLRACDCAITLLSCCVPNLCLDGLSINFDAAGSKLNANGGLGLEVELVPCEAGEQVGLADARVANQDDCAMR